jgi:hypothetical protein
MLEPITEGARTSQSQPANTTCPSWGDPDPACPPCRACHLQLQCTGALRKRVRLQVQGLEEAAPFLDMALDCPQAVEDTAKALLASMAKALSEGRDPDPAKVAASISRRLTAQGILDPWMAAAVADLIMAAGWRMEEGAWTR